jgi:hypothetical protein
MSEGLFSDSITARPDFSGFDLIHSDFASFYDESGRVSISIAAFGMALRLIGITGVIGFPLRLCVKKKSGRCCLLFPDSFYRLVMIWYPHIYSGILNDAENDCCYRFYELYRQGCVKKIGPRKNTYLS